MQAADFTIHIQNMILFPLSVVIKDLQIMLKAFQILDLNMALLKIWDLPPKYLYLGDGFKMLVLWRCRQQILPQCWYPEDIGRKLFHNAVPLKIQIEDSSKLSVPCRWRQWILPKCWQLEDGGSEFLQNVGPHSAKTRYFNSQICVNFLTLTHPQIWCPS
jgi:hypothetical protein